MVALRQTFSSLRVRNYRLYFTGQAISLCGTWMQSVGQVWLVLSITNSGTQLGLVLAAQFLPVLLFGPWGGLVADLFPKRAILYATQTAAGVLALILGALVATHAAALWMVYALAACLGLVNAVDNPTRQVFVLEMVGKGELTNAVSLNSALVNLMRVIGPAIGGFLIASAGLAPLFFLNAASYIAVLVALHRMRADELHHTPRTENAEGQVIEGLRYVKRTPVLRDTLIMMGIIGTLTYEFTISLPLFSEFTFGGDAVTYALMTAAMGLGSLAGALFAARRKETTLPGFIRMAWLFGAAVLVASLMPSVYLAYAAVAVIGFFSINFLSMGNVLLQLESEPQMRGRIMSLWAVAFLGSTPIGGPIIGWIGENVGPRSALLVGAGAALVAAAYGEARVRKARIAYMLK